MNQTKILTREEVRQVLADLGKRRQRSQNSWQNLIVFRLSCCCGLREKEIRWLNLGDVVLGGVRPALRVRKEATKGQDGKRKGRIVPLWWDKGTFEDLREWVEWRRQTDGGDAPFVCSWKSPYTGGRLTESSIAKRWRTAIRVLGEERVGQLSCHAGRHSFCSHALASGRNLAEVRDAAGHRNIATTSIYLHVLERTGLPDVFEMGE